MKIKTLITIVVGKGNEVAPNEVIDLPELEAKRLIAGGFAEEVLKAPATRQKPTPPQIKPQIQSQVSQNPDPQSSLANNDNDDFEEDDEEGFEEDDGEDETGDEDDDTPPLQSNQQPV